jgi:hypothetical protein
MLTDAMDTRDTEGLDAKDATRSTPEPVRDQPTWVPRRATLDGFVEELSKSESEGVRLTTLQPLTTLLVTTQNNLYRIIVREGANVLVKGGQFFPEFTDAHLTGSGFGGSMIKLAWIGVGLRMEIWSDGRPIITSPVRLIRIEHDVVASAPC